MCDARTAEKAQQTRRFQENRTGVDVRPQSTYEAVTRQMVENLSRELHEIKSRLNGLIWMVMTAIVIDVVLRLAMV